MNRIGNVKTLQGTKSRRKEAASSRPKRRGAADRRRERTAAAAGEACTLQARRAGAATKHSLRPYVVGWRSYHIWATLLL